MKTEKNILAAFILNFSFSMVELFGGIATGSVAIISDSVHDLGDSMSIGMSYFFEKKAGREADERYTYGYARYSVMGGLITMLMLLIGSAVVIWNSVGRLLEPREINYDGMLILAVAGVLINFAAAFFTRGEGSVNQRAVNLHMLEDVLGWAVVLVGAIVMRFTDLVIIDPLMSIGVAIFIIINAFKQLKGILEIVLEKAPREIDTGELGRHISEIEGVADVHHIHVCSLDGAAHCATMHIVTDSDMHEIKKKVKNKLTELGICHATLELERVGEECCERCCRISSAPSARRIHMHMHSHSHGHNHGHNHDHDRKRGRGHKH